jgi:hypothetical protein
MMAVPGPIRRPANHGAKNMRKIALSLAVLAAILLTTLYAAPAHAQVWAWVSHNGSDSNPCTAASPCLTIAHALTLPDNSGGEVSCLDAGAFDTFTITFSVTIDCSETMATDSISLISSVHCNDAIAINAPGSVVTLRGLHLNGLSATGCTLNGIIIHAAAAVFIENCVIEGFPLKGILDERTSGLTRLAIKNTIVRNNASAGIVAAAAAKNSVVLENVHSVGNTYGLAVATGNNVVIDHSVMSENSVAGIEADPGAQVFVDTTRISHNASYGIYALGSVTIANSDIAFNNSSINGSTLSFGNNRLVGNGPGTAPTLISQQ